MPPARARAPTVPEEELKRERPREYQLLVADDGSRDDTPGRLEPYARVLPLTIVQPLRARSCAMSSVRACPPEVADRPPTIATAMLSRSWSVPV